MLKTALIIHLQTIQQTLLMKWTMSSTIRLVATANRPLPNDTIITYCNFILYFNYIPMKLSKLKKLQQEYIDAKHDPLIDEDEYIYLDNHIIELQSHIDSTQKEYNEFISLFFLTLWIILWFISLFYYPLVFISLLCRAIWIAYVIYIASSK